MESRRAEKSNVLQGTFILLVLRTLEALGPLHGYGIARRIEQISGDLPKETGDWQRMAATIERFLGPFLGELAREIS